MKYIQPDAHISHLKSNHFAFIATIRSEIIGVIALRGLDHVALYFVDHRYQSKGVGRRLLNEAI